MKKSRLKTKVFFPAMKNYYQCLQIAHIINQLVQASQEIRGLIKARLKCTVKYLWKRLMSYMLEVLVDRTELLILTQNRFQIRLECTEPLLLGLILTAIIQIV